MKRSSPESPFSVSLPLPPSRMSLPDPPFSVSAPAPPLRVSAPAPPFRVSEPLVPVRVSSPLPPLVVAMCARSIGCSCDRTDGGCANYPTPGHQYLGTTRPRSRYRRNERQVTVFASRSAPPRHDQREL